MAELRDAVSLHATLLLVGVFVIEMAFVLSYLGAFHSPTPHGLRLAVVAPAQVRGTVTARLNALPGKPLSVSTAPDAADAGRMILDRTADAALVFAAGGTTDRLLVASAGGPSVAQTAGQIARQAERAVGRGVTVVDIRPPNPADGRGLSAFYLVIGLVIGGYLTSAALAMSFGARPANVHRTTIRLGCLALVSIASGLGGAIIVDPVFGALPGHFAALWGIGTLTTFAAAATGMALQVLFGRGGIALSMLLFVVLGNPSAGGVYPSTLLPLFWRDIGQALPPGAATTLVRDTVYFAGHGTAAAWWVLAAWTAGGLLVGYAASVLRAHGHSLSGVSPEPH